MLEIYISPSQSPHPLYSDIFFHNSHLFFLLIRFLRNLWDLCCGVVPTPSLVPTNPSRQPLRPVPTKRCPLIFSIVLRLKISGHRLVGTGPWGFSGHQSWEISGHISGHTLGKPWGAQIHEKQIQKKIKKLVGTHGVRDTGSRYI